MKMLIEEVKVNIKKYSINPEHKDIDRLKVKRI